MRRFLQQRETLSLSRSVTLKTSHVVTLSLAALLNDHTSLLDFPKRVLCNVPPTADWTVPQSSGLAKHQTLPE